MTGRLVLVVGPSGAGKDTLLNGARLALEESPHFVLQQRDITRPADAGGEDHRAITMAEFVAVKAASGYALDWQAHGLSYGVPVAIDAAMAGGQIVVVNGSRGVIDAARQRYPRLAVIEVSAPPAVLAMRLAARGREDQESIRKRLERSVSAVADHPDVFRVSNDGDVASGIFTLLTVLQGLTT